MGSTTFPDPTITKALGTPAKALLGVSAFAVVGVGLSVAYATTGVGIPCLFRALTGWLCPLCGGTHMGADLLHADIASAWNDNAGLLVALVLLGVRTIGWIVEWVTHKPRRWLPKQATTYALPIALVIAILWMIMRNLM